MATRGNRPAGDAPRGTVAHVPVLLSQVLQTLAPAAGKSYIDATFGAGGYSKAILTAAPSVRVLAIDRDPAAIAAGAALAEQHCGRLMLVEGHFGDLDRIAGEFSICAGAWRGARHRRLLDAARRPGPRLLFSG